MTLSLKSIFVKVQFQLLLPSPLDDISKTKAAVGSGVDPSCRLCVPFGKANAVWHSCGTHVV
jgi:hypothetical protein